MLRSCLRLWVFLLAAVCRSQGSELCTHTLVGRRFDSAMGGKLLPWMVAFPTSSHLLHSSPLHAHLAACLHVIRQVSQSPRVDMCQNIGLHVL